MSHFDAIHNFFFVISLRPQGIKLIPTLLMHKEINGGFNDLLLLRLMKVNTDTHTISPIFKNALINNGKIIYNCLKTVIAMQAIEMFLLGNKNCTLRVDANVIPFFVVVYLSVLVCVYFYCMFNKQRIVEICSLWKRSGAEISIY